MTQGALRPHEHDLQPKRKSKIRHQIYQSYSNHFVLLSLPQQILWFHYGQQYPSSLPNHHESFQVHTMPLPLPLRVLPPLVSPPLATRPVNSQELRVPTVPPLKLRRPLSMLTSRLPTTRSRRISSPPEREETSMPPPLPRLPLMPTSLPTSRELPMRRISSLEDRTRTDSRKSTRTPPPRSPRAKASTTREREPTVDSSRPSLPSEHTSIRLSFLLIEFNAKINKVKIL